MSSPDSWGQRRGRRLPSGEERNYHLMFPDISARTIEVVRDIVTVKGLWRVSTEEGFELLREMFTRFSEIYGIPVPGLHQDSYEHYLIPAEEIGLPRPSLVSACHEYRHHMQKYGRLRYRDKEVDARAWSISVFYLALPEAFDRAWRQGRIWYMPPYPGGAH